VRHRGQAARLVQLVSNQARASSKLMPSRRDLKPTRKQASSLDDARWAAVSRRDKSSDGRFYYAVSTTGIYCRPSCPARQARRAHVRFYDTIGAAEAQGFRPCKRCKPNERPIATHHSVKIFEACRYIEAAEEAPSLTELARRASMSPSHFHRCFKSAVGLTPKAFFVAHRHQRVRKAFDGSDTITAAIHSAGYNSTGRFYANSAKVLGMTPSALRAGGTGAIIRFAVGECSLGAILIAASDKGVCAVLLGDDADLLLQDLQNRFPESQLIGGDEGFDTLAGRVIGFVEDPKKQSDLPLDIRGTAFQHQVWQALRNIPAGSTVSYADLAKSIGQTRAVRAVAGACAANPIAVVVPCHRVVRGDGALSGYRWGIERKRELLKRESREE
jgi:AraC family transcriptional regulator, regulatory protein of adaptative response / methylated-DNA-[protein]-cysteine methyltransferase